LVEKAVSDEGRPDGVERHKGRGYDSKYKGMKVPSGWDTRKGSHAEKKGRYSMHREDDYTEKEPDGTRNKRSVWSVATTPFKNAHFAVYPPELIRPCIRAGCPEGGTVIDPFAGSGTTGLVAEQEGRHAVLIDISTEYMDLAKERTSQRSLLATLHE